MKVKGNSGGVYSHCGTEKVKGTNFSNSYKKSIDGRAAKTQMKAQRPIIAWGLYAVGTYLCLLIILSLIFK